MVRERGSLCSHIDWGSLSPPSKKSSWILPTYLRAYPPALCQKSTLRTSWDLSCWASCSRECCGEPSSCFRSNSELKRELILPLAGQDVKVADRWDFPASLRTPGKSASSWTPRVCPLIQEPFKSGPPSRQRNGWLCLCSRHDPNVLRRRIRLVYLCLHVLNLSG